MKELDQTFLVAAEKYRNDPLSLYNFADAAIQRHGFAYFNPEAQHVIIHALFDYSQLMRTRNLSLDTLYSDFMRVNDDLRLNDFRNNSYNIIADLDYDSTFAEKLYQAAGKTIDQIDFNDQWRRQSLKNKLDYANDISKKMIQSFDPDNHFNKDLSQRNVTFDIDAMNNGGGSYAAYVQKRDAISVQSYAYVDQMAINSGRAWTDESASRRLVNRLIEEERVTSLLHQPMSGAIIQLPTDAFETMGAYEAGVYFPIFKSQIACATIMIHETTHQLQMSSARVYRRDPTLAEHAFGFTRWNAGLTSVSDASYVSSKNQIAWYKANKLETLANQVEKYADALIAEKLKPT